MPASKYNDTSYIGFTSGKLTVVGISTTNGLEWACRCSCNGNIKLYKPSKIYLGHTKSCGCNLVNNIRKYDKEEYIDKIYNGLQVMGVADNQGKYDGTIWKCKCLGCNKIVEYPAKHVVSGRYTSCSSVDCRRKLKLTNSIYDSDDYIGAEFRKLKVLRYYFGDIPNTGTTGVIWECKCLICGRHIDIPAEAVVKGNNSSCGCIKSLHELWIDDILKKHNITYKREVKFNGLVGINGGPLRFDFALIDRLGNKKLLEYNGRQHYEDEEITTSNWDILRVKEHDKHKNEYCILHNIELIHISKRFYTMEDLEKYMIENKII